MDSMEIKTTLIGPFTFYEKDKNDVGEREVTISAAVDESSILAIKMCFLPGMTVFRYTVISGRPDKPSNLMCIDQPLADAMAAEEDLTIYVMGAMLITILVEGKLAFPQALNKKGFDYINQILLEELKKNKIEHRDTSFGNQGPQNVAGSN